MIISLVGNGHPHWWIDDPQEQKFPAFLTSSIAGGAIGVRLIVHFAVSVGDDDDVGDGDDDDVGDGDDLLTRMLVTDENDDDGEEEHFSPSGRSYLKQKKPLPVADGEVQYCC